MKKEQLFELVGIRMRILKVKFRNKKENWKKKNSIANYTTI